MESKKSLKCNNPKGIIKPFDPIVANLLTQIYSACKDKDPKKYTSLDIGLVDIIEKECIDGRKIFERQIKSILELFEEINKEDFPYQKERERLVYFLQRIFEKSNSGKQEFFEKINEFIYNIIDNKFDTDFPNWLGNVQDSESHIQLANALINLFEELRGNTIPGEILNACLSESEIVIVAELSGMIKFISETGENILKVKRHNLIGINIKDIIADFDGIEEFMEDIDEDRSDAKLIPWKGVNGAISVKIDIQEIQIGRSQNSSSSTVKNYLIKLYVN